MEQVVYWIAAIASALCNALGVLGIKVHMKQNGLSSSFQPKSIIRYLASSLTSTIVIFSVLLLGSAVFLYAFALSKVFISTLHPIVIILNSIFALLLGMLILKESFHPQKLLSIVVASIGICLIALG